MNDAETNAITMCVILDTWNRTPLNFYDIKIAWKSTVSSQIFIIVLLEMLSEFVVIKLFMMRFLFFPFLSLSISSPPPALSYFELRRPLSTWTTRGSGTVQTQFTYCQTTKAFNTMSQPHWHTPSPLLVTHDTGLMVMNSLTRKKDKFVAMDGGRNVKWYM